jgi:hypothetical protein
MGSLDNAEVEVIGIELVSRIIGLKAFIAASPLADKSSNDIVSKLMLQNKVPTNTEFG